MTNTINHYRKINGKPPIVYSSKLSKAALIQSQYQKNGDALTHSNNDLGSLRLRINAIGKTCTLCAENVAWGQRDVKEVMESWYKSPGHKKNILSDTTEYGFAKVGDYWTQVYNRE
ncbi:hypothetical protein AYI68_g5182 [Smittium mucronatum]|uniref:SCP domain-containing protein n=1 Tax=Smittium mucronatum TaxID=133383 RepID=A0A1R0GV44_9FUNG|nr:hypothetical protein AYI68_g5182 [Smittium mucronatum]